MKIIEKVEAIKNQDLTATENLEQMYSVIEEKNEEKIRAQALTSIILYVILILGYLAEHLLPFDKTTTNRKDTTRK